MIRLLTLLLSLACCLPVVAEEPPYLSPHEVVIAEDGRFVYVANLTGDSISVVDAARKSVVAEIPVGRRPHGLALTSDGSLLCVANAQSHSISLIDTASRSVTAEVPCGFEPQGLCLAPDGKHLYSANYLSNDISVIDLIGRTETARVRVALAPISLVITSDAKRLLVNHHLPQGPATDPGQTTFVSVVDLATGETVDRLRSKAAMAMGRGMTLSPDGQQAWCVHQRPNFNVTPSQLVQGWVQNNALTLFPLADTTAEPMTVLLDNVSSGVANPYDLAFSPDGQWLYVTHRGVHRLSVLDVAKLRAVLARSPETFKTPPRFNLGLLWGVKGLIRRIDSGGLGPSGMAVSKTDGTVYVANRFSDTLTAIDPASLTVIATIPLGPQREMDLVRTGEFLFHDAKHCFQGWLSCTSCHPKVRADGLNWDLLNDGMTNPKNAKSLVGSHETPPAMALGVRASMEVAVNKGFLFIQFHTPAQGEIDAVVAYLRNLPCEPGPGHRRADGSLDDLARRGARIFEKAKCNLCHPEPFYTDMAMYDVGTHGARDLEENTRYDVPSLRELIRTPPYLHDGRAATLEEVLVRYNEDDKHGETTKLTAEEIEALVAFLETL